MKLLILCQKVNKNDPVLGFFHRWIAEFAKHFETITVVCLEMGEHSLPANVKVLSLGKEERQSRLQYIIHFFWYITHERKNYDAVFVHMNQEYLLLGGWLWRLWGKKLVMWRNHHAGTWLTDIAAFFCQKIFCTSKYSFTAKYKKTQLMPLGVDTEVFKPLSGVKRIPRSVLFIARIAPVKKPDMLIDAIKILKERNVACTASIYGDALEIDEPFHEFLKTKVADLGLGDSITFHEGIPNTETPAVYSSHDICVNLSTSGMYDKTIPEAMACECLSMSSNRNLEGLVDPALLFVEADVEDLAGKLEAVLTMDAQKQDKIRKDNLQFVRSKHSLASLGQGIYSAIQSIK